MDAVLDGEKTSFRQSTCIQECVCIIEMNVFHVKEDTNGIMMQQKPDPHP